jgi:hypothetical protein
MVLRKAPLLETYKIDDAALTQLQSGGRSAETRKALWDLINRNRMQLNMAQLEELIKFVDSNQNTHKQAVDFTDALLNSKIDAVRSYLQRRNNPKAGGMEGKARILVLLDATGSMSEMLTAAKDAVGVMFTRAGWEHAKFVPVNSSISRPRTHTHHHHKQTHTHTHTTTHAGEIIEEHLGKGSDKFEMQFAVYRNYSSGPAKLLESSPWKSNPEDLREFLKTTTASGGQGNEAIEIGFWHANQQADVRRVILIGDAAGNTDAEVTKKRNDYGERRYVGTNFEKPTTLNTEMNKLIEKKIPVDSFFVNHR